VHFAKILRIISIFHRFYSSLKDCVRVFFLKLFITIESNKLQTNQPTLNNTSCFFKLCVQRAMSGGANSYIMSSEGLILSFLVHGTLSITTS
jgi:hypothetical protein